MSKDKLTDEKNSVGKPLKYKTPELMQERIDWYFEAVKGNNDPEAPRADLTENPLFMVFWNDVTDLFSSVTGLCLALDISRQTLINYEVKPEYLDTIKRAKLRVENVLEQRLFHNNPTGCIFNLKNNFGWVDKTENKVTGDELEPLAFKDTTDIKDKVLKAMTDEQIATILAGDTAS